MKTRHRIVQTVMRQKSPLCVQTMPTKMAKTDDPSDTCLGMAGWSSTSPARKVPSPMRLVTMPIDAIVPSPVTGHAQQSAGD
jgi:hypothetical protein